MSRHATDFQDPVQHPVRDPVQHPVRDPVQHPVRHPVRDPVQHPVRDPVQHPVRDPVRDPVQELLSSRPLPEDHVLCSGSVLFPGAFDRLGCPLIIFPADGQTRLSSELSKAEVVDFIHYFHHLHSRKQQKQSLVSVVADLRQAAPPAVRFIAETLLLLQLHQRTVHSVYIIQPKKKDVSKLLFKLLAPSKSPSPSFKKVLLKEIPELSNHIDRSQLPASLGGYLMYCHQSWVAFIKDIDAFVQEFLSVVQRLPSSISTLQTLSRLPLPSSPGELHNFCSVNEAKFRQLRRELGLDELLHHCEGLVEKLRYPETDPCFQDMAGTALFTHTAFDMLHNHSRITAAVEKVELLWQQAFSKARLQLQLFRLRDQALQTTEEIQRFLQEKLQPYKVHIAKDTAQAAMLASDYEASIHTPAMALVRSAEEVIHSVAEVLPLDPPDKESWLLDLERLEDKLHSAVHYTLQTLRAVCTHHHYYDKANAWYCSVLHENFLQELLSGVRGAEAPGRRPGTSWGTIPAWRRKLSAFLKKNPCPDMEELVHLAHLSSAIPDDEVRQAGGEMSHRCMTLRKLLISSGSVDVGSLQKALQWQYYLLRSEHNDESPAHDAVLRSSSESDRAAAVGSREAARPPGASPAGPEGKPASLGSLDSGFDGAAGGRLQARGGTQLALSRPPTQQEELSGASNCEDPSVGSVESFSSLQVFPKVPADSLHSEVRVQRSAELPSNPWLSLPVDDLENSFTVAPKKGDGDFSEGTRNQCHGSQGLPTLVEKGLQTRDWVLRSQTDLEDPQLVLSSTITDGRDATMCSTEGLQTLLWDSYDLHDQNLHSADGVAAPCDWELKEPAAPGDWELKEPAAPGDWELKEPAAPGDWELKEQEGLRRVELMLGRAGQILEEEEHVVAQEAELDALLGSEVSHDVWPEWSNDDAAAATQMSSWELAEAGVLGLEDSFDPALPDGLADDSSDRRSTSAAASVSSRTDLVRELQQLHLLDQLIREEKLKIQELCGGDEAGNDPLLERQSTEEEEDLDRGLEDQVPEVVGRVTEELSKHIGAEDCSRSEQRPSTESLQKDCWDLQDSVDLRDAMLRRACEDGPDSEVDSLIGTRTSLFSSSDLEDHSDDPEGSDEPQTSEMERLAPALFPDVAGEASQQQLHRGSEDRRSEDLRNPEPSFTPRLRPDEETFDPGLKPLPRPPAPKPRTTLKPANRGAGSPDSTGSSDPADGPGLTEPRLQAHEVDAPPESRTAADGRHPALQENTEQQNHRRSLPVHCSEPVAASTSQPTEETPPPHHPAAPELPPHHPAAPELPPHHPAAPELPPHHPAALELPPHHPAAPELPPHHPAAPDQPPHHPAAPDQPPHHPAAPDQPPHHPAAPDQPPHHPAAPDQPPHHPAAPDQPPHHPAAPDQPPHHPAAPDQPPHHPAAPDQPPHHPAAPDQPPHHPAAPELPPDHPAAPDQPPDHPAAPDQPPEGRRQRVQVGPSETQSSESVRFPGVQDRLSSSIRQMTDYQTPVVLDTGSSLMKAGLADQDLPQVVFPTIIGMPKYEEIMNDDMERETFIGQEAQHMRGVLALKYPIKNGIVGSWDDVEKIWHHAFQQLSVDPEDHPVLLTEAATNPRENRQRMVEIMFECFSVPLSYVAMQAVLALYADGRTTGVVLDSGHGVSHSVPVFEGYCLSHAVQRLPLAGADITAHLKKLLQEQGVSMRTTAEEEIVREMKEKCCYVALDYEAELKRGAESRGEASYYTLPDGHAVTLDTERFRATELLFRPELIGRDHYGMHESVFKSVLSSDIDLRRSFLGNIVLSGGTTLLPGLLERLQAEVSALVPAELQEGVRVSGPRQRDLSVWSGGAVLAGLQSFSSAWISLEEYQECGPQVVFRKCF